MTIVTAVFKLDLNSPEDVETIDRLRRGWYFDWQDNRFEATSVRHSRNGLTVTAKAVKD